MKQSLSRDPRLPEPAPFRSLLVPIDLTPSSDRVLGRLPLLPLAEDARVTVLHVVPSGLTASEQRKRRARRYQDACRGGAAPAQGAARERECRAAREGRRDCEGDQLMRYEVEGGTGRHGPTQQERFAR